MIRLQVIVQVILWGNGCDVACVDLSVGSFEASCISSG